MVSHKFLSEDYLWPPRRAGYLRKEAQTLSLNSIHFILENSTKETPNSYIEFYDRFVISLSTIPLQKQPTGGSRRHRDPSLIWKIHLPVAFTTYQIGSFFVSLIWNLVLQYREK